MRGKRSKEYRKLIRIHEIYFGFREPFQCLLDAAILLDAARFKMNFTGMLERTLHGSIKPMITTCSMRHLYASPDPNKDIVITAAKHFERRRCNHHELEEPLSTMECLTSVVDPKGSGTNKFRYVVCTQDENIRARMRAIPGVPMIYLKRSVMIMEPISTSTLRTKGKEEREKLRAGIKKPIATNLPPKDEVMDDDESMTDDEKDIIENEISDELTPVQPSEQVPGVSKKKRRVDKKKRPNPLSARKSKKKADGRARAGKAKT